MNNGAPLNVIQSLLGHEKSETTWIYAQLSGSIRQDFYRKLFLAIEKYSKSQNSALTYGVQYRYITFSLLPLLV
nr:hypothetical protein [Fictibacillus solisalsi]